MRNVHITFLIIHDLFNPSHFVFDNAHLPIYHSFSICSLNHLLSVLTYTSKILIFSILANSKLIDVKSRSDTFISYVELQIFYLFFSSNINPRCLLNVYI